MTTSSSGIAFIKRHEGFEKKAYQCSAGVWTIGYGHTVGVRQGDVITLAQAEALLASDLKKYEAAVNAANIPGLNQNQFDALVSLCYNIGVTAFGRSTLVRRAKVDANDATIRAAFLLFKMVGGKLNAGLYRRRTEEANMYFGN